MGRGSAGICDTSLTEILMEALLTDEETEAQGRKDLPKSHTRSCGPGPLPPSWCGPFCQQPEATLLPACRLHTQGRPLQSGGVKDSFGGLDPRAPPLESLAYTTPAPGPPEEGGLLSGRPQPPP